MSDDEKPKYACVHCGATEYCTQPDSYAIYVADGDTLQFSNTELVNDEQHLYCRECGEEASAEFVDAAT